MKTINLGEIDNDTKAIKTQKPINQSMDIYYEEDP